MDANFRLLIMSIPHTKTFIISLFISLITCGQKFENSIDAPFYKEPQIFLKGIVSTEADEFDISFTANMDSLLFTRRRGGDPQKIYFSTYLNHQWTEPTITPFSIDRDEFPSFSKDGKSLYFGSTRPIANHPSKGTFDMNIWRVRIEKGRWGIPKPLDTTINKIQRKNETWPSSNESFINQADHHIFFYATMKYGDSLIHIYRAKESDSTFISEKIVGLFDNDNYWKSSPVISPDGKYLFFNAYGTPSGFGGEDIYVSRATPSGFSKAINLGNLINTDREDAAPRFSTNGQFFFFSRLDKSFGNTEENWNIYWIETKFLNLKKLFENDD